MKPFVTFDEMSEIDRKTIETLRGNSFALMKSVAQEASEILSAHSRFADGVLIFCGPGNNGGDGYCLAEYLRRLGFRVACVSVEKPQSADCKKAYRFFRGRNLKLQAWKAFRPSVIVDCIFGVNGRSRLSAKLGELLQNLNSYPSFRVAFDLPTGVSVSEESSSPDSFCADLSLCVGFPKTAMLKATLAEYLGEVIVLSRLFLKPKSPDLWMLEPKDFSFRIQRRVSHKGVFGKAAIIGGSASMPGAAILAAEAAARVGAGYASLFFAEAGDLRLKVSDAAFILKQKWKASDLQRQSAWALGCGGLPRSLPSLTQWKVPVVLDAEVFSRWTRSQFRKLRSVEAQCLLTPHAGEAAKLLGWDRRQIELAPLRACEAIVELTGQSCYLKGAPGYLIFSEKALKASSLKGRESSAYVNLSINPVFARAGSGDVLSGILVGFLAQRPEAFVESVISGMVFQNQLGEVLRANRALLSSDLLKVFDLTFKRLHSGNR